jgi:hypothetical protein
MVRTSFNEPPSTIRYPQQISKILFVSMVHSLSELAPGLEKVDRYIQLGSALYRMSPDCKHSSKCCRGSSAAGRAVGVNHGSGRSHEGTEQPTLVIKCRPKATRPSFSSIVSFSLASVKPPATMRGGGCQISRMKSLLSRWNLWSPVSPQ